MNRGELVRQRRCRLLLLAMLFGVLLPVFQPGWITLGVAVAGELLLGITWWRSCRSSATSWDLSRSCNSLVTKRAVSRVFARYGRVSWTTQPGSELGSGGSAP